MSAALPSRSIPSGLHGGAGRPKNGPSPWALTGVRCPRTRQKGEAQSLAVSAARLRRGENDASVSLSRVRCVPPTARGLTVCIWGVRLGAPLRMKAPQSAVVAEPLNGAAALLIKGSLCPDKRPGSGARRGVSAVGPACFYFHCGRDGSDVTHLPPCVWEEVWVLAKNSHPSKRKGVF
ncbi:hypothetical protein SKAU_G00328600 [Synaphobranchus kaupii]|uniref:Uncharacterized protein n=1 Tax=Synaphobranchus kaupii TaxID=118154 RepID=A0A9Q1IKA5_SYNKA|nr:hypothetical protein SKAU_G00328600 [Synaphobranchus kaupii]